MTHSKRCHRPSIVAAFSTHLVAASAPACRWRCLPGRGCSRRPVQRQPVHARRRLRRSHSGRDRAVDAARAGAGRSREPGPGGDSRRLARRDRQSHAPRRGARRGLAPAELAHSVHVEVTGLLPGRDYFYQFDVRSEESPDRPLSHGAAPSTSWRARSASRSRPARTGRAGTTRRIATCCGTISISCFTSATTPTSTRSVDDGPRHSVARGFEQETVDLRTYRLRHTLYKLDPDLQAVHAKFPFVVIWDDHEVANDYSGLAPEYGSPSPEFTARRAAAYQAYYEHMPIRSAVARKPRAGSSDLPPAPLRPAGRVHDARRSAVPIRQPVRRRRGAALRCGARPATTRMLGREQEQLGRSRLRATRRLAGTSSRSSCSSPSWSTPRSAELVLERRLGRLPAGAPAAAERGRRVAASAIRCS